MNLALRSKYGLKLCCGTLTLRNASVRKRWNHTEPSFIDNMPRLLEIRNGEKMKGTFSKEEMDGRVKKLRKLMATENIDGVLFTSYHNVNYYSDYLYCDFGRPYGLVVTQDKLITISAKVNGAYPWRKTVTGDNLVYTDWHRDNYFRAINQELGQIKGKIGCEFDIINVDNYRKLQNALPGSTVVDIGESAMRLRMKKSDEEIAHIKNGARIADIGGGAIVEALAEGVGEHEIALHAVQTMVKEIAKSRPDIALQDTWSWFQSGHLNSENCHNPVTSRKVQKGDICVMNCFPMMAGYYTALERNIFLDHASDEHIRVWEANCKVFEAGKKLIKPGTKCKDVARGMNEVYASHGLLQYRSFGYGHSFGVLSHYYGREAALEFREDIDTVLEPNMVMSLEPMIALPESHPAAGGYREHDIMVVTEDGSESITHFPYGPENMIIKK